jgi:hypothetical protein
LTPTNGLNILETPSLVEAHVRTCCLAVLCLVLSARLTAFGAQSLLPNGGFEQGTTGWNALWTREADAGMAELDSTNPHEGARCMRITHRGVRDWSLDRAERIAVSPGDVFEMRGWARAQGTGSTSMCLTLRDNGGQVINWTYAARTLSAPSEWRELTARFVIPRGAATIQPRFVGNGSATISLDDISVTREGKVEMMTVEDMARVPTAENAVLRLELGAQDATFDVTDKRTGRVWRQVALPAAPMVSGARPAGGGLDLDLLMPEADVPFSASVRLDGDLPELVVELRGDGAMAVPLRWPEPFVTRAGDLLIMPVNEGISYPADDASLPQMRYILYGGHGLCMAWYGVTSRAADGAGCTDGMMAIIETPDDASVAVPRHDSLLVEAPQWDPQKGAFGYVRRIRYVFLADGGYVAMARRYRAYAAQIGLLRTLAQKREKVPAIDMLVGAVNVWCWQQDAPGICRRMQSLGIDRILWSHRSPPEQLAQLNAIGVLTSRYDIQQDVMDPANFAKLNGVHPDWPTEAWPKDCIVGADGKLINGWMVRGKDGQPYYCNVLCDLRAPDYARLRIAADLKDHPYRCRFIDTTTASPWRECYSPDHAMTRTQSRQAKMELLRVVSEEFGLVCGSETGHDAAVPFADYFEGMMSLGPYRVPDAGRNMQQILEQVPERVATFQTGPYYRLPLWELVYHDCVVAQWYWGDYNNKLPALWDRRDLFNALYATPPMFMFNAQFWAANEERFVQSYRQSAAIVRACGYSEMSDHRWLTADHTVQQTRFANGVTVTVNFGDKPYDMPGGALAPMSKRVEGL